MKRALWACVVVSVLVPAVGSGDAEGIELRFLNGVHSDLDAGLEPWAQRGLSVTLSSPRHRLVVHGNRLSAQRAPGSIVEGAIELDVEGEGRLLAELRSGPLSRQVEDRVVIPRQTLRVAGKARFARTADGFIATIVELPPSLEVRVESELAERILGVCRAMRVLPFVSGDCRLLRAWLARVSVPLPAPGERLPIDAVGLSEDELSFFEALVAGADGAS